MTFKKIDREFCLTDNSLNVYSYRLLTEGLDLSRFNPAIGFLMHNRDLGVAVKWEDFRIDNDKLYAKPVVNTSKFPDLADQIEAGFYACASVGKIVALELSDDATLKLDGQKGPTVTKWFPRECSIVDIGGNYNAVAFSKLYDTSDNVLLDLCANNQLENIKNQSMNKIELSASHLLLIDLKDDATVEQTEARLRDLVDKASKYDIAEKELSSLKSQTNKDKVTSILEKGLADRRLSKEIADTLESDYAERPEALKKLVDAMKPQELVTGNETPNDLPAKYKGKTFAELYASNELEELKADYPDYYETLKSKIK